MHLDRAMQLKSAVLVRVNSSISLLRVLAVAVARGDSHWIRRSADMEITCGEKVVLWGPMEEKQFFCLSCADLVGVGDEGDVHDPEGVAVVGADEVPGGRFPEADGGVVRAGADCPGEGGH